MTDKILDQVPQGVPIVCDMSTDFLTRTVDWTRFSMVYADASHNVGPSGVTVVIARHELLNKAKA